MNRRAVLHRWLTSLAVIPLLVMGFLSSGSMRIASAHSTLPQSARLSSAPQFTSPDGDPLLLVHGFNDSCEYAFNQKDMVPNTGLNATTTVDYLTQHGWTSGASGSLDEIGYYAPTFSIPVNLFNGTTTTTTDGPTFCTHNLQELSDQAAMASCAPLLGNNLAGTLNDPLEHLGCLFAWYIYDTYTLKGIAVDILAHSMGGLIVRDAIGESGHTYPPNPAVIYTPLNTDLFPPTPLNVHVVVTVGTPHGGVEAAYFDLAQALYPSLPQELLDMNGGADAGSGLFLAQLEEMGEPQGLFGTYWALIASSVPGGLTHFSNGLLGTGAISWYVEGDSELGLFPDGDGVVQADSALAMAANLKILYGSPQYCPMGSCTPFPPGGGDIQSQYSHEANTCSMVQYIGPFQVGPFCLTQPFYLNDGTSGYTQAYVCNTNCTATESPIENDMHVVDSYGNPLPQQPVLHSLAEMVAILSSQGPGIGGAHRIGVGQNSDGRLELFARGSNGTLSHNWQNISTPGWSGWVSLGGSLGGLSIAGEPAVGRNSDGRLEVFARASDGSVWHIWQNNSPAVWSNWAPLGGFLSTSDPVVGQNSNGSLEVFARGPDGSLWTTQQSTNGTGWGSWFSLGGQLTSDPAVGQNSDGRLEVFVRATDGTLWHTWQNNPNGVGGWATCCSLGGQITSDPVVARNSDGRLEVFARASDGSVWHTWQNNPNGVGGWATCCSLGGQIIGDPVVGQNTDGRLEVFVLTPGGSLWHIWQKGANGVGGWSGWENLGEPASGPLTSDPAVGQNSDGRLEVFARGSGGTVWHVRQNVSAPGWSSWEWMGSM